MAIVLAALVLAAVGRAGETVVESRVGGAGETLSNLEEIWRAERADAQARYRVKLDFVVYYYDPLWKAMWGRCGDAEGYLSLGSTVFPIKAGQRISIEGHLVPAKGMIVEEPRVSVLAETVPLEAVSTRGEIGNIERFNKRLVTLEGLVDRQELRDANHLELALIGEGRTITAQVLLKGDALAPVVRGAFVQVKGVYFARPEVAGTPPKIELWVQSADDLAVHGWLERDERFNLPATPIASLAQSPADTLVRIVGEMRAQQAGKAMTIRDETGEITVQAAQTRLLELGASVEAIGFPTLAGAQWTLRQSLYRAAQPLLTSIAQIWQVPEARRQEVHRARLVLDVYFHDPRWKVMWARNEDADEYVTVGELGIAIKPGQRILLEGVVIPAKGAVVENAKATLLGGAAAIAPLPTAGRITDTARFNGRLVTVEGYVDRQGLSDAAHADIDLVVEDRPVTMHVLLHGAAPSLEGTLLRAEGVYSATIDPVAQTSKIELWVQGVDKLRVLGRL